MIDMTPRCLKPFVILSLTAMCIIPIIAQLNRVETVELMEYVKKDSVSSLTATRKGHCVSVAWKTLLLGLGYSGDAGFSDGLLCGVCAIGVALT